MALMASLRNRIARAYGDVDPVRVARELPVRLDHVERMLGELSGLLTA